MTPTPTPPPGQTIAVTPDLIATALLTLLAVAMALLLTWVLAGFARRATLRALRRTRADQATTLLVGRITFFAIVGVGTLVALGLLGVPWPTVVALTGVLGLAISLALQDVLKNVFAGLYLLVERPFRIGEQVKVKEFLGRVETVNLRTTVLRTEDGDTVLVPNAILFAEVILNRGMKPSVQSGEDPARV